MEYKMKLLVIILYILSCSAKLELPDYKDHECKRACNNDPLTCKFNFTIEWIYSMGPECQECKNGEEEDCLSSGCILVDGNKKLVVVANRMLPGPSIEVCRGDTIIVNVFNNLHDATTTIHWHGQHQRATPWMDGVPMVTQCPIQPMTTFRYRFKADTPGTHFWHSHSGTQRSQGLFGPLIVREQLQESLLYDFDLSEHVITVMEWTNDSLMDSFYKLNSGKMRTARKTALLINGVASVNSNLPIPIFDVEKGFKYRFRIINNGFLSSPVHMKIQNHNLKVISVDGCYVEPVNVDAITLANGERIDFILEANQESDYYWIDFTLNKANKGLALLKYKDTSNTVPNKDSFQNITETKLHFNCIDTVSAEQNCTEYTELKSLENPSEDFQGDPSFKYYINVDMFKYARPEYQGINDSAVTSSTFNNITFKTPTTNLMESEIDQILCNAENKRNCDSNICDCTHMVEIPYQNLVEIILIDKGDRTNALHPLHLHGNKFQIIGGEKLELPITEEMIKELDVNGQLKRNLERPPFKDVITVPIGGYVIIRFFADNPGYWFFHCHLDYHMMNGMAMIFKVGDPPKPPQSFPKCGDYLD